MKKLFKVEAVKGGVVLHKSSREAVSAPKAIDAERLCASGVKGAQWRAQEVRLYEVNARWFGDIVYDSYHSGVSEGDAIETAKMFSTLLRKVSWSAQEV